MNLLEVGVKLKAENIQSFIDDFLKIDGVKISDIRLYEDMILINKIKYKSFGTIAIGVNIERIEDGVVSVAIKKLKAISIPISIITVNFILKMVLNKLNIKGVSSDGKQIKVDLGILFKEFNLDFVALDVKNIDITEESINVVIGNIDLNMLEIMNNSNKKNDKDKKEIELNINSDIPQREYMPSENVNSYIKVNSVNTDIIVREKVNQESDFSNNTNYYKEYRGFNKTDKGYFLEYSRVRKNIYDEKFRKLNRDILGKIVFLLPDIGVLCYRLLRDKRVKKGIKAILVFAIAYMINPFDFVNKKFPILDKIDDGLLLVFTLYKIFTGVDREILEYHFEGDEDTLNFLIDSFDILNGLVGGERINKLYNVFDKFVR